jgi:hypothetical protein
MENYDVKRIATGETWWQRPTLTLSNGKTYFLDIAGKRLRNVEDPLDGIQSAAKADCQGR